MASERLLVTFPVGLRDRAHAAGLNISGVAASAVLRTTQAIEKETGADLPGLTPAVTPKGATS